VTLTPIDGMQAAEAQVSQTAARIAGVGTQKSPEDSVDLSAEMISLIQARDGFQANVKAQQVMDQVAQTTLDLAG
jgi:flagellar hook protein FlgE